MFKLQNKLDFHTTVLDLRAAAGSLVVLGVLRKLSNEEWERCRDDASDTHLIKGVIFDSKKTEAIRAYIAKIVRLYMNTVGPNIGAWTKNSLENEHVLTKAVSDKICNSEINTADQLFEMVITRLIGVDSHIVRASLAKTNRGIALGLVGYLSARHDESVDPLVTYAQLINDIEILLDAKKLNDEFYDVVLEEGGHIIFGQDYHQTIGIEILEDAIGRCYVEKRLSRD
ncbi:hypothetical protein D3C81_288020 [compost metagenome]